VQSDIGDCCLLTFDTRLLGLVFFGGLIKVKLCV
jgi:hypothetical protein